jgi:hypothetical protein
MVMIRRLILSREKSGGLNMCWFEKYCLEKGYDCSSCDIKRLKQVSEEIESRKIDEALQRYKDGEERLLWLGYPKDKAY